MQPCTQARPLNLFLCILVPLQNKNWQVSSLGHWSFVGIVNDRVVQVSLSSVTMGLLISVPKCNMAS
jgi:hypothetical protein